MAPALLFLLIAIVLIGTELLIMQLSVFWFLFFGLGALVTSLVCWAFPGITMVVAAGLFLVSTLVITAVLYPLLKRWQSQPGAIAGNDAIGQTAKVIETISPDNMGKVFWSGTEWPAQILEGEQSIEAGESVKIQKLEGIRLIVSR
jgi:membrane protein implicated in regulation of membrane protease activity